MLPDSSISPDKAAAHPAMFADTGLPRFFQLLASLHSRPAHLQLFVAGGANVILGQDPFRIGERNLRATVDYLTRHGYMMKQAQIGGSINRTVHLELATGMVTIKTASYEDRISPATGAGGWARTGRRPVPTAQGRTRVSPPDRASAGRPGGRGRGCAPRPSPRPGSRW